MSSSYKNIDKLPEFKTLVNRRWLVATILTILVFITYYGFVLVIGLSKPTLAKKIGEVTTLGIPVAVAVIVISFLLTLYYVIWANSSYDSMASSIINKIERKQREV